MPQKAVVGLTDISARKHIRKQLGDNLFTFLGEKINIFKIKYEEAGSLLI